MAKVSELEKALANLYRKRDVLDAAIEELRAQQSAKPKRERKAKVIAAANALAARDTH